MGNARPECRVVFRCLLYRKDDLKTALINGESPCACEHVEDDITSFFQNGSILDENGGGWVGICGEGG